MNRHQAVFAGIMVMGSVVLLSSAMPGARAATSVQLKAQAAAQKAEAASAQARAARDQAEKAKAAALEAQKKAQKAKKLGLLTAKRAEQAAREAEAVGHEVSNGAGVYKWHDGRILKGEWRDDRGDGYGVLSYPDGKMIWGFWSNGHLTGYGLQGRIIKVKDDDGKYTKKYIKLYVGEFIRGSLDGYGVIQNTNLLDDKSLGEAIENPVAVEKYTDYEGELKSGRREGYGVSFGRPKYLGHFSYDARAGYGVLDGNPTDELGLGVHLLYKGEFMPDIIATDDDGTGINGYGVGDQPDNYEMHLTTSTPIMHYEGEWSDGKMDGYGVMTYANGVRYEGQWEKGRWNGYGVKIAADGSREYGYWTPRKDTSW